MIDTYVEELCDPGRRCAHENEIHYLFNGQCLAMDRRVHRHASDAPIDLPGGELLPDIIVERTVHGRRPGPGPHRQHPRGGEPQALHLPEGARRGDLHPASEPQPGARRRDLRPGLHPPSLNLSTNWSYANASEIGYVHGGLYPVRPRRRPPRPPLWGTGDCEWQTNAPGDDVYLGRGRCHTRRTRARLHLSWNNSQAPGWTRPRRPVGPRVDRSGQAARGRNPRAEAAHDRSGTARSDDGEGRADRPARPLRRAARARAARERGRRPARAGDDRPPEGVDRRGRAQARRRWERRLRPFGSGRDHGRLVGTSPTRHLRPGDGRRGRIPTMFDNVAEPAGQRIRERLLPDTSTPTSRWRSETR